MTIVASNKSVEYLGKNIKKNINHMHVFYAISTRSYVAGFNRIRAPTDIACNSFKNRLLV